MSIEQLQGRDVFPVSRMADSLQGSEIIKLAGEINEKINKGKRIFNFTIGDFDPAIFPIPDELREEIINAYRQNQTNYPAANGIAALRESIARFIHTFQGLDYSASDYLVAGGARPLIYAAYQTLVDPGDKVVFPVPSWNNNHYTHLSHANQVFVETKPENNFMPTAAELEPHLKEATLLALCSPLNPTGTVFTREDLYGICELVMAENKRRKPGTKPLYLLYDQIYWTLTFGETRHDDPVSLLPEIRPYTLFIDGISKSLAATGVRVGWAFGPSQIIDKMKSILGHIGAWSPKAEQVATAVYLASHGQVTSFMQQLKDKVHERLHGIYQGLQTLKEEGFPVQAIAPQAAIYLTVSIDLTGYILPNGTVISQTEQTTRYLLEDAGLAIVPFYAFGASRNSTWYRISVGTCLSSQIPEVIEALRSSLLKLSK
jgi:aspartate aminotransferase